MHHLLRLRSVGSRPSLSQANMVSARGAPAPGDDHAAIVTGASSGIGEAMALELCAARPSAVSVARTTDRLHALAENLSPRAHVLPADISCRTDRAVLPGRIAALGLVPEVLINNAGLSVIARVAESVPEQELNLIEVMSPPWSICAADSCREWWTVAAARCRTCHRRPGLAPCQGKRPTVLPRHSFCLTPKACAASCGVPVSQPPHCVPDRSPPVPRGGRLQQGEREAASPSIMWKPVDKVARAGIDGLAANKGIVVPGPVNRRDVLSGCAARAAAARTTRPDDETQLQPLCGLLATASGFPPKSTVRLRRR